MQVYMYQRYTEDYPDEYRAPVVFEHLVDLHIWLVENVYGAEYLAGYDDEDFWDDNADLSSWSLKEIVFHPGQDRAILTIINGERELDIADSFVFVANVR